VDTMMSAKQVAEFFGLHENWVYDQAASGHLPSYKLGGARRFLLTEIQAWLADHRESPRTPDAHSASAPPSTRRRPRARRAQPRLFDD
jgi:excisionase family DNA binding protein